MTEVKEAVQERVIDPVVHSEWYRAAGVGGVDGAVLYGPPGCGAKRLPRAVAGELDLPFVRVAPDLLVDRWTGDPGVVLADVVSIARANQPCVLFFEDLHAVTPASDERNTGITLADRLAGLLRELADDEVVVFGTAPGSDTVDANVIDSGCFDERLEVPLPDAETRAAVLRKTLEERLVADGFDWERAADAVEGLSLPDVRRVAVTASRTAVRTDGTVTVEGIRSAAADVDPRTSTGTGVDDVRYIE
jgi:ATP-dependent 26S proteasome regulatory subunit